METANEIKLEVAKEFSVPAERLYQAWIKPEELKQWWHPMGNQLQEVVNNIRKGGEIKYVFGSENGDPGFTITGQYEEVKEGERLVYSWNWEIRSETVGNSQYKLTVLFTPQGAGSRLQVTQENFTEEEAVHPHRDGWDKALNELQQFVSANQ